MMTSIKSKLSIHGLALPVFLGWTEEERQKQQTVLLEMEIKFAAPPKACESDLLDDTYCYDRLIQSLQKQISTTPFRLIEHLACVIYQLAKTFFPQDARVTVGITKHPDIKGLTGGASFSYGDDA